MRHLMPLLAAAALVLSTSAAHADLGDQLFKLLPNDGWPSDSFGWSVAVSGTTAIVGASSHDENGTDSGSAYLFDTTTGQQIVELLADDGAPHDHFGFSVAISGTTAIVGAAGDDDKVPAFIGRTPHQSLHRLLGYWGQCGWSVVRPVQGLEVPDW